MHSEFFADENETCLKFKYFHVRLFFSPPYYQSLLQNLSGVFIFGETGKF